MDWQSQCAMEVTDERGVYAKELRFLPTVGCEADASTVVRRCKLDPNLKAPGFKGST